MENNGREFLDEIKAEIEFLRSRLDVLEAKLAASQSEEKPMEYIPAASFDEPIDFDVEDVPAVSETVPETQPEPTVEEVPPFDVDDLPVEEPAAEPETPAPAEPETPAPAEPETEEVEDLPVAEEAEPEMILTSEPEPEPAQMPKQKKVASESATYAWRTDMAGSPVANIISGISLNDRVLFINTLFSEDPILFQASLARFNAMGSLQEAEDYIAANFPGWNLSSEVAYRFMMAVRRKLK